MSEEKKVGGVRKTSIGGQALIEGIMMRGPRESAMAVRDTAGEIVIESWNNDPTDGQGVLAKLKKIPVVRGVFNFADSMIGGYKSLVRSAEISGMEEEEKEQSKGTMAAVGAIAGVLGVCLSVVLFIFLPTFIYDLISLLSPSFFANRFLKSLCEGILKIAILVGYMAAVSQMPDIKRTFRYHGAEHKTIFCYEAGLPLTVENVREQRRFHPRCGTSFLVLMVLVGIFIGMLIPAEINTFLRVLIKLLLLPVTMGIGYELIKLAGRHDNAFTKIISAPGLWLQRITVLEPDDSMIECAIAAIEKVIPDDGSDIIK